jgi:hypothetical protein
MTRAYPTKGEMVLLAALGLAGCAGNTSSKPAGSVTAAGTVYIPGPDYHLELTIRMPQTAKVGEWFPLEATRKSGPWVAVDPSAVPAGVTPLRKPPPEIDNQVASNLSWDVEPKGAAETSVPKSLAEARAGALRRSMRFTRSGEYKVSATTAFPTPGKSNVVTIRVEE